MTHPPLPPPIQYRPCPFDLATSPGSSQGEIVSDRVIEKRINTVSYTILPGNQVMVCTVVLDTGYSVWGACTCDEHEAIEPAIGQQCSYREVMRKLRVLFGFLATESRHLYIANTWHLRGEI